MIDRAWLDMARVRLVPESALPGIIDSDLCRDVAAWLDRCYKPDRLRRETGTRTALIADRTLDVYTRGYTLISHHDSVTGVVEWFPADGLERFRAANVGIGA